MTKAFFEQIRQAKSYILCLMFIYVKRTVSNNGVLTHNRRPKTLNHFIAIYRNSPRDAKN